MTWVQAFAPSGRRGAAGEALEARARRLLAEGGDERIFLHPATGLNRYGCGLRCEPGAVEFSSSTASTPSGDALTQAAVCLERLEGFASAREAYTQEAQAIRRELAALNGLSAKAADDIILAASGTDLHSIAADLARGEARGALTAVMPDPRESGGGVPNALRGLRYSQSSPHGGGSAGGPLAGAEPGRLVCVPVREPSGGLREGQHVDAEVERACEAATAGGEPVLLVVLDVSKTGIVAPSPACAARLKARFGEALNVLVDACQFRISAETLARYLACGFLVAVTGSKFLGGPAFSGALFAPEACAARLRRQPLLPALGDVSGRADWPAGYVGRAVLPDLPNFGLALRWRAALHELAAFRQAPAAEVRSLLAELAWAVEARLDADPRFERLAAARPRRFGGEGWDGLPTIFPFLPRRGGEALDAAATQRLYERLRDDPGRPVRLGQPVPVGVRNGAPVSALRLAIRAGQVLEALEGPAARRVLIERALGALAIAAET